MKPFVRILILVVLFASCDDLGLEDVFHVKSRFDKPFPKRNKDLTWTLGDEFTLLRQGDTMGLSVSFNDENEWNYIINKKSNDTLFAGAVSKYRGLYYFNRQINDSSYWISAVKIDKNTIAGIGSEWAQMKTLDMTLEKELNDSLPYRYSTMLNYQDTVRNIMRLKPDKKLLKQFYESIIDSIPKDSILYSNHFLNDLF